MKILRYLLTALLFTNITFSQDLKAKLNEIIKPLLDSKKNLVKIIEIHIAALNLVLVLVTHGLFLKLTEIM